MERAKHAMPAAIGVALALIVVSFASRAPAATPGDPFEKSNRRNFETQERFDRHILGPLVYIYSRLTPGVIGKAIHNILINLREPQVFINDMLQLRPARAGGTAVRFVVNTTIGLGGMIDVAGKTGLPHHLSSFGDTLGHYGVRAGAYLFFPAVGPSTVRDFIGNLVDDVLNPLHFVNYPNRTIVSASLGVTGGFDQFRNSENDLQALLSNAADPYATLRSTYLQNREAEVSGHTAIPATLPDLDAPELQGSPPASSPPQNIVPPGADQPATLLQPPGGQTGQTDAQVAGALGQQQGDGRLGAQALDGPRDCIADLLYAQAHWREEGGRGQRADHDFQSDEVEVIDGHSGHAQRRPDAHGAEGPRHNVKDDTEGDSECPVVQVADQAAGLDGTGRSSGRNALEGPTAVRR